MTPERIDDLMRSAASGSLDANEMHDVALALRTLTYLMRDNEKIRYFVQAADSRNTIDAIGDFFGRVNAEYSSELHAGHYLVAQSLYTAPNVRPGWMICVRCKYETPSHGWCGEHETLDACWAKETG
jgi:hypothetical protein